VSVQWVALYSLLELFIVFNVLRCDSYLHKRGCFLLE
jgi:hypothetical protein